MKGETINVSHTEILTVPALLGGRNKSRSKRSDNSVIFRRTDVKFDLRPAVRVTRTDIPLR